MRTETQWNKFFLLFFPSTYRLLACLQTDLLLVISQVCLWLFLKMCILLVFHADSVTFLLFTFSFHPIFSVLFAFWFLVFVLICCISSFSHHLLSFVHCKILYIPLNLFPVLSLTIVTKVEVGEERDISTCFLLYPIRPQPRTERKKNEGKTLARENG